MEQTVESEIFNRRDKLEAAAPELLKALEKAIAWMDFVADKLGDSANLDKNIRKYGARLYINQFGQGAKYRAIEARAAIAKATQC